MTTARAGVGLGARIGSAIAAAGGLAFVLVNAGTVPTPLDVVARVLGVVLFLLVLALVVVRPPSGPAPADGPPSRRQQTSYALVNVGMIVAFFLGAFVLRTLGYPDLQLVWVVFAVGLHFLPLGRIFRVPLFTVLGGCLMAVAVIGTVLRLLGWLPAPGTSGTVAGLLLLGFALAPRFLPGRPAPGPARARG